jgi:importin subunit beta-1
MREYFNFARIATPEVVPVLLELLAKQDEDAADDEYNISRAAYQCLQLWAQTVGGVIAPAVLNFVETHLRSEDWHYRDAAVSAFGAIMEGPDESLLDPLIKQALPVMIGMMEDQVIQVRDSVAYALGRICETCSDSIDPATHLQPLISSLFNALSSHPKMASSCCWALMNLADRFAGDPGCEENALSAHFQNSVTHLLQVTERYAFVESCLVHWSTNTRSRTDADHQLRTAAYEVLNAFVTNSANDSLHIVAQLTNVILERLESTVPMGQQIVSIEDKLMLEEMQTSLTSVVIAIIQRLETEVKPQADRIMQLMLQLLNTLGPKSSVPDTIFAAVGALASAVEEDFAKYMEAFSPFLYTALANQEEPAICAMAIGLVSDISRALNERIQPFCDSLMNNLLNDLRVSLANHPDLQCFSDEF